MPLTPPKPQANDSKTHHHSAHLSAPLGPQGLYQPFCHQVFEGLLGEAMASAASSGRTSQPPTHSLAGGGRHAAPLLRRHLLQGDVELLGVVVVIVGQQPCAPAVRQRRHLANAAALSPLGPRRCPWPARRSCAQSPRHTGPPALWGSGHRPGSHELHHADAKVLVAHGMQT